MTTPDNPRAEVTIAHVRELLSLQLEEIERRILLQMQLEQGGIIQRLDLEREARLKAESAMDRRLEGMNELRGAMRDQSGLFVTREAFEAKLDMMTQKIDGLSRLVYIGVGAILMIQLLLKFVMP